MGLLWEMWRHTHRELYGGNNMEHLIITINRQYGSGGSQIGKALGEYLNIPCYERIDLDRIAHERGEDRAYIPEWREITSSADIWGADESAPRVFRLSQPKALKTYYSNEREMFAVQSRIIRELAGKQSCVLVGRCANHVLNGHPMCLRVLIYASEDSRALRAYNEYYERSGNLAYKMECIDKGRASYYKRCTGQAWDDNRNYQMCLDSGVLGIDGCVAAIAAAAQQL